MRSTTSAHDNPICIIGMHRSGTSMVARLLNLCGLNLGPEDTLLGPSSYNAMGHFEHISFLEIDEALLQYLGGSWDNPRMLSSKWEKEPGLHELIRKAEKLVDAFSDASPWGWKDPRAALLIPFWQKLIPNVRYVICVRNPVEVAHSLATRDGISIPAGVELWSQYMRAAIRYTEHQPRILTFYEDYFIRPLDELSRLCGFCGLGMLKDPSTIRAMISGELRHHTAGSQELLTEATIPLEYKFLYLGLRVLSWETSGQEMPNRKMRNVTALGPNRLLDIMDDFRSETKATQLESMLAEKERQLTKAQRTIAEKEHEIATLEEQNARLQTFANVVRKTMVYRAYKTLLIPLKNALHI